MWKLTVSYWKDCETPIGSSEMGCCSSKRTVYSKELEIFDMKIFESMEMLDWYRKEFYSNDLKFWVFDIKNLDNV